MVWLLIAILIAIGFALVVVVGGIIIMVSTTYLKILFAIGPLFIMALMFPVTAKFFDSWIGYVLNHTLIVAMTAVVLTLGVTIYDHEITKATIDSDQNMLGVALELLVVAAILYAITKGVVSMAAALAGGLSMAVMGVGGLGRSAAWATQKMQRNPAKPGGNSAQTNAQRPARQPAYNQNVLHNMQRRQN